MIALTRFPIPLKVRRKSPGIKKSGNGEFTLSANSGRWRKMKGVAVIRLPEGSVRKVDLHWFEAHGIGKKKMRIKRFLD